MTNRKKRKVIDSDSHFGVSGIIEMRERESLMAGKRRMSPYFKDAGGGVSEEGALSSALCALQLGS